MSVEWFPDLDLCVFWQKTHIAAEVGISSESTAIGDLITSQHNAT